MFIFADVYNAFVDNLEAQEFGHFLLVLFYSHSMKYG